MTAANGRAQARRIANNTPTHGAGAGGDTLATAIGMAVALHLGQVLAPMFQGLARAAAGQKTACVYCAARRKIAEHAHTQALTALRAEWEIACAAAAELGDSPPEFTEPEPPALPDIQEAFTWVPVVIQQGTPPTAVPVCYDDLPEQPAAPGPRPTGLVTGDGRPVIAQG